MAGAGFKTFNTGDVLTSSDVNTYLMQQTVMVFDDASARSTALPTPSEGMFSYLKDTNLTYRYDGSAWLSDAGTTSPLTTKGDVWGYSTADARIPVGANGTVLTADSAETLGVKWATPAAGGAYTSIASGSLSSTTVSITSINGGYRDLYLILDDVNLNSSQDVSFRFNNDTTSNYHQSLNFGGRVGGGLQSQSRSGTTVEPTYWYLASGDNDHSLFLRVNNYVSSFTKTGTAGGYYKSDNTNWGIVTNIIGYQGTSAITQIDIIGGSTFDGGTYTLYGVK